MLTGSTAFCVTLNCLTLTSVSSVYSSPRSALTPVGPNRLTLLPNQQQPSFAPRHDHQGGGHASEPELRERPGSSRYAQYYTFITLVLPWTII